MRKLIFLLLLNTNLYAQNPLANGIIASSIHSHVSQTIKLAFNSTSSPSGVSGFNDVPIETYSPGGATSGFLLNSSGATTTVKFTMTATYGAKIQYSPVGNPTPPNTDFPNGVASNQWYNGVAVNADAVIFTLTGLTPSTSYNVKTYHFDNSGGTLNITVTVGSATPQTGNQEDPAGLELTFTASSDASGNIQVTVANGGAFNGCFNGLIITG